MVLGNDHPVHPEGLGRPEERAEVPRVLDLVEGQEERRLPPLGGHAQEVVQVDVLGRGHPGDHALVVAEPAIAVS